MSETIVVNQTVNTVEVTESVTTLNVSSPGPQGPRGKTILNGTGAPSNNLGLEGDFYYDKDTTRFYGPKPTDLTWAGADNYLLSTSANVLTYPFSIGQVINQGSYWAIEITHNLGYNPNATVKNSAGDILETGIDYNSINKITLTMAQPFGGTAYLS
jgi:hypothetical protein